MPELPDVTVYVEAIAKRIVDQPLLKLRLGNPFVLRTVDPPPSELAGKRVVNVRRVRTPTVPTLDARVLCDPCEAIDRLVRALPRPAGNQ